MDRCGSLVPRGDRKPNVAIEFAQELAHESYADANVSRGCTRNAAADQDQLDVVPRCREDLHDPERSRG